MQHRLATASSPGAPDTLGSPVLSTVAYIDTIILQQAYVKNFSAEYKKAKASEKRTDLMYELNPFDLDDSL